MKAQEKANTNEPSKIVLIAGGSASGKTTLASRLAQELGAERATVLAQDRYYRHHPSLSFDQRAVMNFDDPSSIDWELLHTHANDLVNGQTVDAPVYDFAEHLREDRTETTGGTPIVIIEGMYVLVQPELLAMADLKVFVECDPGEMLIRRLERDQEQRGRSRESVVAQYRQHVMPMYQQFCYPSRENADLVVLNNRPVQKASDVLLNYLSLLVQQ